jgi:hypothetical protein
VTHQASPEAPSLDWDEDELLRPPRTVWRMALGFGGAFVVGLSIVAWNLWRSPAPEAPPAASAPARAAAPAPSGESASASDDSDLDTSGPPMESGLLAPLNTAKRAAHPAAPKRHAAPAGRAPAPKSNAAPAATDGNPDFDFLSHDAAAPKSELKRPNF